MPPLVTIMIPTYNQAGVIGRAIESALSQDYPEIEIIVADDNSPDETQQKVSAYLHDHRLRYVRHSTNLGRVRNYKTTLEQYARGQWVVNLDGDDYYCEPTFISQCMELVDQYADETIVFVSGGKVKQRENRRELSLHPIKGSYQLLDGQEYFLKFPFYRNFSHMSTLYNRQMALSLDFYRKNITSADLESFLRLALHGKVILVNKAFGVWMEHETNASNQVDFATQEKNLTYVASVSQYALRMGLHRKVVYRWKRNMIRGYYQSLIFKVCSTMNFPSAVGYIYALLRKKPGITPGLLLDLRFLRRIGLVLLKSNRS